MTAPRTNHWDGQLPELLLSVLLYQITKSDATWFDNGLKISIIGTPGDANYRLSFQSKKNNVWYGDILFDRHD